MSVRRKGRELALMALYSLDGVPAFEREETLEQFWSVFDREEVWKGLFVKRNRNAHPLDGGALWELFKALPLTVPEGGVLEAPPFAQAANAKAFAMERLLNILPQMKELDMKIMDASQGWRLQRMSKVDRNILRLGAYELSSCPDIPPPVVINEAIELSKGFSTRKAGSFINGVLDRINKSNKRGGSAPVFVRKKSRKKS